MKEPETFCQMETAFNGNDKKFLKLFNEFPIGFLFYGPDGSWLKANQASLELLRVHQAEILQKFNLFETPLVPKNLHSKIRNGDTVKYELLLDPEIIKAEVPPEKDSELLLSITLSSFNEPGGSNEGYFLTLENITYIKFAEEQIKKILEQWEQTFDSIPDMVAIIDKEHRLIRVNKAIIDKLNIGEQAIIGKKCHEIFHRLNIPITQCPIAKTFSDKKFHTDEYYEPVMGIYLEVTTSPIFDIHGNVASCVHIMKDISERKHAQRTMHEAYGRLEEKVQLRTEELKNSLYRLEEANIKFREREQLKSKFISSMSHELRTPLNGILGFTELLKSTYYGPLNERQMEYVKQIENCGKHQLSLVNNLLEIHKIDAGEMKLSLQKVYLNDCIEQTLAMTASQMQQKFLILETTLDPEIRSVIADISKLREIVLNLLSNAMKFTPKNGLIRVSTKLKNEVVYVSISDTGIGIEAENLEKIFSEFFQADHIRDEALGGTGIGLAITKRLVELHGGSIWVESEPGCGSTFIFTLPIHIPSISSLTSLEQKPAFAIEKIEIPTSKILIADDDPVNRTLIGEWLLAQGHHVLFATNGREAVDIVYLQKPDVVFMDLKMPHMSGTDAVARLRNNPEYSKIPIIAVTALTGDEIITECYTAGFSDVLLKPFDFERIKRVLEKVLKKA